MDLQTWFSLDPSAKAVYMSRNKDETLRQFKVRMKKLNRLFFLGQRINKEKEQRREGVKQLGIRQFKKMIRNGV